MPRMFGYGRASTGKQKITLTSQESMCQSYYDLRRRQDPELMWGGWYPDAAVTSKIPMLKRPMGERIYREAVPGDMIVVSHLDRAFRSPIDCDITMDKLIERKIGMIMLDVNVDSGTIIGRMILTVTSAFARMEREMIGQRTKEAMALHRTHVKPIGKNCPVGWQRKNDATGFKPDVIERDWCKLLAEAYNLGYTMLELYEYFHKILEVRCTSEQGRSIFYSRNRMGECYVAAVCNFPKLYAIDLPTMQQLFNYLAEHDGRPPQLEPLQVEQGLLYTLPPAEGPLLIPVPRNVIRYRSPYGRASGDRFLSRRAIQAPQPLSSWLDKHPGLRRLLTPTPSGP